MTNITKWKIEYPKDNTRKVIRRLAVALLPLFFLTGCQEREDSLEMVLSGTKQNQRQEEILLAEVSEMASESETGQQTLWVHICGYVKMPGIYEMPTDSRLYDLLMAAGGFADGADETVLNLADYLKDGSQIYVPGVLTQEEPDREQRGNQRQKEETESALVNINTASRALLETLPGIGEAKAKEIIAYRTKNGSFASIEEIKQVDGIKDALFQKIESLITVEE